MSKKILVLLSGGLKSGTLVAMAKKAGHEVVGLFWAYGQRNAVNERDAAKAIMAQQGGKLLQLSLPHLLEVEPAGAHGWPLLHKDEIAADRIDPYIPGLIPMLAVLSIHVAMQEGCQEVQLGWTNGSAPEASPGIVNYIGDWPSIMLRQGVRITAPLMQMNAETRIRTLLACTFSAELIGASWSCLVGGDARCQSCRPCKERAAAFKAANAKDREWSVGVARIAARAKAANPSDPDDTIAPTPAKPIAKAK